LLSADGAFEGGAILPGIRMAARALHEMTDLLPQLDMVELEGLPPVVGRSTLEAIRAGLFWGTIGAIRALAQENARAARAEPDIFLTGGAAPAVAMLLGPTARYVASLVLSGIALAALAGSGSRQM
jgi:type III pantothenate kinase